MIVADKQNHLQFTTIDEAIVHCTKGMGIWPRLHRRRRGAGRGAGLLRRRRDDGGAGRRRDPARTPADLKLRFVNVVDLFSFQPIAEHPHGSTDSEFDSLFTTDKPIIFSFHGYPWLIHRLATASGHDNMHVRGARRRGTSILRAGDAQRDLALQPGDRHHRSRAELRLSAAHLKEEMKNAIVENMAYAHEHGHGPQGDHGLGVALLMP